MILLLIKHHIIRLIRQEKFDHNLFFRFLLILYSLYLCSFIFFLGIYFNKILLILNLSANPLQLFHNFLFYIIPFDCLARFLFQRDSYSTLQNYLHLPISRNIIISFIIIWKNFNLSNLFYFLFLLPFSFNNILPNYGWLTNLVYLLTFFILLIFITNFTLLFQMLAHHNIWFAVFPLLWVASIFIIKVLNINYLEAIWQNYIIAILKGNFIPLVFTMGGTYFLIRINRNLISNENFGLNYIPVKKRLLIRIIDHISFRRVLNSYFLFESNIIIRNKRVLSISIIGFYLLILIYYIFLFRPQNNIYIDFILWLFLSGSWSYSYLQLVFSIESSFFDFIVTSNFNLLRFLKAKYMLTSIISLLLIVVSLPIIILTKQNFFVISAAYFYNIGVGYFIVLLTGTFNNKRIELSKSIFMNYQGQNLFQWFSISFVILLPTILLKSLSFFVDHSISLLVILLFSLISLLYYNKWFHLVLSMLSKRKYKNLEGYRI